jgi:hypothetical protein
LHTLLVKVEFLVNSRPLTYVSSDPNDPESITPNHILLGPRNLFILFIYLFERQQRNLNLLPPGRFHVDDEFLRHQWRISQH